MEGALRSGSRGLSVGLQSESHKILTKWAKGRQMSTKILAFIQVFVDLTAQYFISHIPYAPWCWCIYLQIWAIYGVNDGNYSIHGAYGYGYSSYFLSLTWIFYIFMWQLVSACFKSSNLLIPAKLRPPVDVLFNRFSLWAVAHDMSSARGLYYPIWMNKNDLIVTSLEWWLVTVSKGTHQQIADYFRYFQVSALLQFSRNPVYWELSSTMGNSMNQYQ